MIPKECKRLAEVDFPIAEVGKHALAEKAMRMGTPHQLHLWWAWRPLAACRAILLALIMPDPCDDHCPIEFKREARDLLSRLSGNIGAKDKDLRTSLLKFIANFSGYDVSTDPLFLEVGRGLVRAANPDGTPLVVDPFAGGGSIPLEALRLGSESFASDLNPVACLILKSKLDDIPHFGRDISEELHQTGLSILKRSQEDLIEIYPKDTDESIPIAYLWARTIYCESPNCGAEIPLIRSFWLSKKTNRMRALRIRIKNQKNKLKIPEVEFEIFEPKNEKEVSIGTVTRSKATCLCCNTVLPPERVRAQLAEQRGGADSVFNTNGERVGGAWMLAVVTVKPGVTGRQYRIPHKGDYYAVWKAQKRLSAILAGWEKSGRKGLCPVPDEPLPPIGTLGFRVQRYGMLQWGDLFTARQKVALLSLIGHAHSIHQTAVQELLALSLSKLAERNNSICDWMVSVECPGHLYTQQVIPPAWDFAEAAPLGGSSGSFELALEHTATNVIACYTGSNQIANVDQLDATNLSLPDESASVFFTDPPYYDAVPYSDLSDFFYVWLKRVLPQHPLLQDRFDPQNPLTPKILEAVQDETKKVNGKAKDRKFFEGKMTEAFTDGRRVLKDDGIACIVFAHKTTEGWEALLTGMTAGGWVITGSWPIATERSARMRARESAALESSVHLICRPRPEDAPIGDWGEVLRELPKRVGDWMERLQNEGVRGADLVFACIGPALEIFSRYSKVETAEGREVKLPEFLEKVWEVVGRLALEQILGTAEAKARNGLAGALEEDARLTALFLWTLQATNGNGNN
jgi:putative DNA methylase